ncbi:uncharacterized protein LOC135811770 isoform X2 [Sycon ciliatum]|uniref:uncharacterized protein LOC135811770 isoform X2 n=1 Tax=Sycon ciliatum TaxID=27933 RepID=UPI0031F68208
MDDAGSDEQRDYAAFLEAYSKPTQIYSYLKHRQKNNPVFLHRSLSYLQVSNRKPLRRRNIPGSAERVCSALLSTRQQINWQRVRFFGPCHASITELRGLEDVLLAKCGVDTAHIDISLVKRSTTAAAAHLEEDGICHVVSLGSLVAPCTWKDAGETPPASQANCAAGSSSSSLSSPSCSVDLTCNTDILPERLQDIVDDPPSKDECWCLVFKVSFVPDADTIDSLLPVRRPVGHPVHSHTNPSQQQQRSHTASPTPTSADTAAAAVVSVGAASTATTSAVRDASASPQRHLRSRQRSSSASPPPPPILHVASGTVIRHSTRSGSAIAPVKSAGASGVRKSQLRFTRRDQSPPPLMLTASVQPSGDRAPRASAAYTKPLGRTASGGAAGVSSNPVARALPSLLPASAAVATASPPAGVSRKSRELRNLAMDDCFTAQLQQSAAAASAAAASAAATGPCLQRTKSKTSIKCDSMSGKGTPDNGASSNPIAVHGTGSDQEKIAAPQRRQRQQPGAALESVCFKAEVRIADGSNPFLLKEGTYELFCKRHATYRRPHRDFVDEDCASSCQPSSADSTETCSSPRHSLRSSRHSDHRSPSPSFSTRRSARLSSPPSSQHSEDSYSGEQQRQQTTSGGGRGRSRSGAPRSLSRSASPVLVSGGGRAATKRHHRSAGAAVGCGGAPAEKSGAESANDGEPHSKRSCGGGGGNGGGGALSASSSVSSETAPADDDDDTGKVLSEESELAAELVAATAAAAAAAAAGSSGSTCSSSNSSVGVELELRQDHTTVQPVKTLPVLKFSVSWPSGAPIIQSSPVHNIKSLQYQRRQSDVCAKQAADRSLPPATAAAATAPVMVSATPPSPTPTPVTCIPSSIPATNGTSQAAAAVTMTAVVTVAAPVAPPLPPVMRQPAPSSLQLQQSHPHQQSHPLQQPHPLHHHHQPQQPQQQPQLVLFNFMHNGATLQQTLSRNPWLCPWCSRNCRHVAALTRHLRASHPRFTFHFQLQGAQLTVNVQVNESYEHMYSGDAHDLFCMSANRTGCPQRRRPQTKCWVARPSYCRGIVPVRADLNAHDDLDCLDAKDTVHGDRVYFRSATSLPLLPAEMEMDSEDEETPAWLIDKTEMMMEEFSDVNVGEKAIMKLWNTFALKFRPISDMQMPEMCMQFVEEHWTEIRDRGLPRNFLLHLACVRDYGLLTAAQVYDCHRRYMDLCKQTP